LKEFVYKLLAILRAAVYNREDFLQHYHKRSNVESTVAMVKAKFRDSIRSKGDVAMKNEVLAKIVCHNICCLIQEMHELGIEPMFWTKTNGAVDAQKAREPRQQIAQKSDHAIP
jgi:hypothetical protein